MRPLEKIVERKGRKFLLRVEDAEVQGEYRKYEELRNAIWDWPGDPLAGPRNMMCENFFHDGGSLFIGVFRETEGGGFLRRDRDHLVGFAYGFVGVTDKARGFRDPDNIQFYSQYTGVQPGYERFGLGIPIKEFQKEMVLDRMGIRTITCTYDPLTGVNAYRNVHHFGMEVTRYNVDIYGEFGGRLNRADVPSDRLSMSWNLMKAPERPVYDLEHLLQEGRSATRVDVAVVEGKNGPVELEILRDINLDLGGDRFLIEIPFDFYRMLGETDTDEESVRRIPMTWRLETRRAFVHFLDRGCRVVDFRSVALQDRRRNFYVLTR